MVEFKEGFAQKSGNIPTYQFNTASGEYTGVGVTYVTAGFSLPAGATLEEPPEQPQGQVAIWQDDAWSLTPDHRGTVYKTSDGSEVRYTELGELPDTLTTKPRPGPAYKWSGTDWVFDQTTDLEIRAQQEMMWRDQQLFIAGEEILKHEDGDTTATNTQAAWRSYRIDLRAWPKDPSFPDSNNRPTISTPPETI